jgi:hypothetical protein
MKRKSGDDGQYSKAETEQRREGALKRLLSMPPRPITKPKPEAERKKRGRPPKPKP